MKRDRPVNLLTNIYIYIYDISARLHEPDAEHIQLDCLKPS